MSSLTVQGRDRCLPSTRKDAQQSNIGSLYKRSVAWLKTPKNLVVMCNCTIAGFTAYQLIQQGFNTQVLFDLLTHSVTAVTFLAPTKTRAAIGAVMDTVRAGWILSKGFYGDPCPVSISLSELNSEQRDSLIFMTNFADFIFHANSAFMHYLLRKSPSMFERQNS